MLLHMDLDAFFAACEEARNPTLKGKPVIIGAPRGGRGVVATANYEARKYGVRSALPIKWAEQRCSEGIFLPVDFSYYHVVADRIFSFIDGLGFQWEQMSIDEAVIDIEDSNPVPLIEQMRAFVKSEKLTCSIGVAGTRTVAKIASEYRKPNGVTIVDDIETFLAPLNIGKIPGIGKKSVPYLQQQGLKKISDVQAFSEEELVELCGEARGRWLYRVVHGKSSATVGVYRERRSIGAERTFMVDADEEKVYEKLQELIVKIYGKMRDRNLTSKTMQLKIRYADFETHTAQKSSISTFSQAKEAVAFGRTIVRPFLKGKKIRLIGARFLLKP